MYFSSYCKKPVVITSWIIFLISTGTKSCCHLLGFFVFETKNYNLDLKVLSSLNMATPRSTLLLAETTNRQTQAAKQACEAAKVLNALHATKAVSTLPLSDEHSLTCSIGSGPTPPPSPTRPSSTTTTQHLTAPHFLYLQLQYFLIQLQLLLSHKLLMLSEEILLQLIFHLHVLTVIIIVKFRSCIWQN